MYSSNVDHIESILENLQGLFYILPEAKQEVVTIADFFTFVGDAVLLLFILTLLIFFVYEFEVKRGEQPT